MAGATVAREGRRSRAGLGLIVAAFIALGLLNIIALPVFEASDEASHFIYADFLARERRFPDLARELPAHEAAQPPLYYILTAAVISPFDRSNLAAISQLNPDWFDKSVNADFASVRNLHIHTSAEAFPYQGAVWAVRAARLFSLLFGAATIAFVYLIAGNVVRGVQDIDPGPHTSAHIRSPAAIPPLAAALVAFNPKFVHVSSIVSNDIAIILAATAACWWMTRMMRAAAEAGAAEATRPRAPGSAAFAILGALIGIGVLCKVGSLGLFVPAAAVVWALGRPAQRILRSLLALGAGFALTAGWWFIYNTLNYGDPLAWDRVRFANEAMLRETPLTAGQLIASVPEVIASYFGNIGIELSFPAWINAAFALGLGLAVVGCVVIVTRTPALRSRALLRTPLVPLIAWEAALIALYVVWLRSYVGTENGRLIMPGIALLAILVAAGWLALAPRRIAPVVALGAPAALFALSLATPFFVIAPAFAEPDARSEQEARRVYALPDGTGVTFDGAVKLLHAELGSRRVRPGETVDVTAYWGALRPIEQSYRVVLLALDADGEVVGRKQFIPFQGRFATQRWQPGLYFRDTFALPIDAAAQNGAARIELGLFRLYPEPGLLPIDGAAAEVFTIGRVKVAAAQPDPAASAAAPIADFGGYLRLDHVGVAPGTVTFDWTALAQPDKDYTLFVHVLDAGGAMIGQFDAQPFDGGYPTGLWDANERVRDERKITLPAVAKQLRLGWYDSQNGQRLTARKADGTPWQDDSVLIDVVSP